MSFEKTSNSYAEIISTKTLYKLRSGLKETLTNFLASVRLTTGDIDLVLLGINGNVEEDFIYNIALNELFKDAFITWYKHLCGEYETSASFALLLAARLLKTQNIPEAIKLNNTSLREVKNVLIYQQRFNRNHSFTVLSKC